MSFISDPENEINEENIHTLYNVAIGQYLPESDRLKPGIFYRHGSVYIIGQKLEHTGLPYEKLPEYMSKFITFINAESTMNDLLKATVIHFYIVAVSVNRHLLGGDFAPKVVIQAVGGEQIDGQAERFLQVGRTGRRGQATRERALYRCGNPNRCRVLHFPELRSRTGTSAPRRDASQFLPRFY